MAYFLSGDEGDEKWEGQPGLFVCFLSLYVNLIPGY